MNTSEKCVGEIYADYPACLATQEEARIVFENREACARCLGNMALSDQLTGAGNRNKLLGIFNELQEASEPIGAIQFDVKNFKFINDTYGHSFGDEMIKNTAQYLLSQTRTSDFISAPARRGGDEFAVLARLKSKETGNPVNNPVEALGAMGHRLQVNFLDDPLVVTYNSRDKVVLAEKKISLSMGFAVHTPGESLEELMAAADPKVKS